MIRKLLLIILLTAVLAACTGGDENEENAAAPVDNAEETATSEIMPEETMATDEAMMEEDMAATDEAMMEEEDMATEEAMMEEEDMVTEEPMAEEEMMDEAVSFTVTIENVSNGSAFSASGVFNTPTGAEEPGPAMPASGYEIQFNAAPGDSLTFATMFVQSNDWFFAPDEAGIPLFDAEGIPVSGDVTDQVLLWDAGTEVDQEPGAGEDQAPRQAAPDTGDPDPDNTVRQVMSEGVPAVPELIQVTLEPGENNSFLLRIDNVSGDSSLPTPISPGVFAVHTEAAPLFASGEADRGEGLEAIAEDGDPAVLAETLTAETALTTPLSPGVYAVHEQPNIIFVPGEAASDNGLEALAEDGDPAALAEFLAAMEQLAASGVFDTPNGAGEAGPIMPGGSYSFSFEAVPGYHLTLATMFVQSNDLFYALENFALFDAEGNPVEGEITMQLVLWDAGTEVNEQPGAGPNQAPRQSAPDTGETEGGVVMMVDDGYSYPETAEVIQITITVDG